MLAGYRTANGADVVVTNVLGPGPGAFHGRHRFHPDSAFHTSEIERIYWNSGRVVTYLGDWHTHPHGPAFLSWTDIRTLRRISADPAARAPNALMAILPFAPEEWGNPVFWSVQPIPGGLRILRWPTRMELRVGDWGPPA